ncbi:cystathionine gamma-synthase [Maritimibacter sp. 55A14]|uniref:trans-sulfuration enzyme family protein n=1 Tax=Maritimibacter sp. 55A14 TaxID=2174844 RepID=UPI000D60624F|nr:aminotransferase class I/II-fold pyridoxal phosphate-dependent enzyme [Maritimibacter sp. 55A14]PWE33183.1 cystathionine gamma-synthase [Maritimibacter sp. 55A14]
MGNFEDSRSVVRRTRLARSASRPLVTPLEPSVVYTTESPDELDAIYEGRVPGHTYAREGHPNADVLAAKIDWLEGAEDGLLTGSGMAALSAILMGVLIEGDHVIGGNQLYGRSMRMLRQELPRMGFGVSLADPTDPQSIADAIRPETRMIVVETVSNPTLRVADIPAIAEIAAREEVLLVVDNTFTTPRAFRPFEHGADILFHSVTKLLAGHSDATLGYVAARDPELRGEIRDTATTWGFTPSPYDCWLAERGLHSFALRYDRAQENAAELAEFLDSLDGVKEVIYPGLMRHPDHARANRLFAGMFGNIVSFRVPGGREVANRLVRAAGNIAFAPTLGDVATTLSHPASSSHRGLRPAERDALGMTEGFFRISVGIEDIELLKAEFEAAIGAALSTEAPAQESSGQD